MPVTRRSRRIKNRREREQCQSEPIPALEPEAVQPDPEVEPEPLIESDTETLPFIDSEPETEQVIVSEPESESETDEEFMTFEDEQLAEPFHEDFIRGPADPEAEREVETFMEEKNLDYNSNDSDECPKLEPEVEYDYLADARTPEVVKVHQKKLHEFNRIVYIERDLVEDLEKHDDEVEDLVRKVEEEEQEGSLSTENNGEDNDLQLQSDTSPKTETEEESSMKITNVVGAVGVGGVKLAGEERMETETKDIKGDSNQDYIYSFVVERATMEKKIIRHHRTAPLPEGFDLASKDHLGLDEKGSAGGSSSSSSKPKLPVTRAPTPIPTSDAAIFKSPGKPPKLRKLSSSPSHIPPKKPCSSVQSQPQTSRLNSLNDLMQSEKQKKLQTHSSRIQYSQRKSDPSRVASILSTSGQTVSKDLDVIPVETPEVPELPPQIKNTIVRLPTSVTLTPVTRSSGQNISPKPNVLPASVEPAVTITCTQPPQRRSSEPARVPSSSRKREPAVYLECQLCQKVSRAFNDHEFRKHMLIRHQIDSTDKTMKDSTKYPSDLLRCLSCSMLISNKEDHSVRCAKWKNTVPMDNSYFEECVFNLKTLDFHKCGICSELFGMRYELRLHFEKTHGSVSSKMIVDPNFRCAQCLQIMPTAEDLGKHCLTCTVQVPSDATILQLATSLLKCEICKIDHDSIMKTIKCYLEKGLFRCVLCLTIIKNKGLISDHMKLYHSHSNSDYSMQDPGPSHSESEVQLFCPICQMGPLNNVHLFPHIVEDHYQPALVGYPNQNQVQVQDTKQVERHTSSKTTRPPSCSETPRQQASVQLPQQPQPNQQSNQVRPANVPRRVARRTPNPNFAIPPGIVFNTTRVNPTMSAPVVMSTPSTISQPVQPMNVVITSAPSVTVTTMPSNINVIGLSGSGGRVTVSSNHNQSKATLVNTASTSTSLASDVMMPNYRKITPTPQLQLMTSQPQLVRPVGGSTASVSIPKANSTMPPPPPPPALLRIQGNKVISLTATVRHSKPPLIPKPSTPRLVLAEPVASTTTTSNVSTTTAAVTPVTNVGSAPAPVMVISGSGTTATSASPAAQDATPKVSSNVKIRSSAIPNTSSSPIQDVTPKRIDAVSPASPVTLDETPKVSSNVKIRRSAVSNTSSSAIKDVTPKGIEAASPASPVTQDETPKVSSNVKIRRSAVSNTSSSVIQAVTPKGIDATSPASPATQDAAPKVSSNVKIRRSAVSKSSSSSIQDVMPEGIETASSPSPATQDATPKVSSSVKIRRSAVSNTSSSPIQDVTPEGIEAASSPATQDSMPKVSSGVKNSAPAISNPSSSAIQDVTSKVAGAESIVPVTTAPPVTPDKVTPVPKTTIASTPTPPVRSKPKPRAPPPPIISGNGNISRITGPAKALEAEPREELTLVTRSNEPPVTITFVRTSTTADGGSPVYVVRHPPKGASTEKETEPEISHDAPVTETQTPRNPPEKVEMPSPEIIELCSSDSDSNPPTAPSTPSTSGEESSSKSSTTPTPKSTPQSKSASASSKTVLISEGRQVKLVQESPTTATMSTPVTGATEALPGTSKGQPVSQSGSKAKETDSPSKTAVSGTGSAVSNSNSIRICIPAPVLVLPSALSGTSPSGYSTIKHSKNSSPGMQTEAILSVSRLLGSKKPSTK